MSSSLTSVEWLKLQEIIDTAVGLEPVDRERYVAQACGESLSLRSQVDAMLAVVEHGTHATGWIGHMAAAATAHGLPSTGERLGPYRLLEVIGRGGMGIVYRALRDDDHYRQEVAIKVASAGYLSPELLQRFVRERQILANLNHPNIARLLDGGATTNGVPYVVIEFVDGLPIDVYCRNHTLDLRQRIELIVKVIRAVDYAHKHLVVHRDLKPDNIHVTAEGKPKLLDFGIAKALDPLASGVNDGLTVDLTRLMTPEYASPEQVRGEAITTATDVYQIGVLLCTLLAGRKPFERPSSSRAGLGELERMICEALPPRPGINRDLDQVILHALEKDPRRRYASAGDLADDLERYLDGFPIQARVASRWDRAQKFVLRNKLAASAASLLLFLLIGFTIALGIQVKQVQHQRDVAKQQRDSAERIASFLTTIFSATNPSQSRGKNPTARDLLDQGTANIEKQDIADPIVKDRLLVTLAQAYESLSVYDHAEQLFQQSLQIREKVYGENSKEVVEALGRLARACLHHEDYDRMATILPRWQRLATAITGQESQESIDALNIAAADALRRGDLITAESMQQHVIEIAQKLHGPQSPEAFRDYGFLGYIQLYRGENYKAEQSFRALLKVLQKGSWQDSSDVVSILELQNRLGYLLTSEGRYAEAEPLLHQSLDLAHKILGPHHSLFANAELNMEFFERSLGRLDEAERLAKDAVAIHTNVLGADSLYVGGDTDELARVYLAQGRYREAESLLHKALTNFTQRTGVHGPGEHGESAYMARVLAHLGQAQLKQGHLEASATTLHQALANEIRFNGDTSFYAADNYLALGQLLQAQGRLPDAELAMRKALAIYRGPASENNAGRAQALQQLSGLLLVAGRPEEARHLMIEAAVSCGASQARPSPATCNP